MDSVSDIKSRLSIEELVGQYCQIQKKGRNFVALCPFHKDSHPSLLISPDKGIAYCFACQKGGDIFSFYQEIEGVDFPQALRDLAERTGVTLADRPSDAPKKGEKDRLKEVIQEAVQFYRSQLTTSQVAQEYLKKRGIAPEFIEKFQLGYAPDSFSATYEHLLKKGFSRSDIVASGLGAQKDLKDEKIYDRFRHRLMFPIFDGQGTPIAFGGRTLGNDDAKYINSSDGPLYHKSQVLFGLNIAKEAMRERKRAILVEGYFDVVGCHRVGVENVVAASGTALTEQHVKLLKRYVDSVTLCMDQDSAGQEAAERAFTLLSEEQVQVFAVALPTKDPDELANSQPELLKEKLLSGGIPYIDFVLQKMQAMDLASPSLKRMALQRVLTLLSSVTLSVERQDYIAKAAAVFGTTETALSQDLLQMKAQAPKVAPTPKNAPAPAPAGPSFSNMEIVLGMFLFYPQLRYLMENLVKPEEGMALALYEALERTGDMQHMPIEALELPEEYKEKVSILWLFGENYGFSEWSEALAIREIKKNCVTANKEFLRKKQQEITQKLILARREGKKEEEEVLSAEYQDLLKTMKVHG
jgi:DNA primase